MLTSADIFATQYIDVFDILLIIGFTYFFIFSAEILSYCTFKESVNISVGFG